MYNRESKREPNNPREKAVKTWMQWWVYACTVVAMYMCMCMCVCMCVCVCVCVCCNLPEPRLLTTRENRPVLVKLAAHIMQTNQAIELLQYDSIMQAFTAPRWLACGLTMWDSGASATFMSGQKSWGVASWNLNKKNRSKGLCLKGTYL